MNPIPPVPEAKVLPLVLSDRLLNYLMFKLFKLIILSEKGRYTNATIHIS